MYSQGVPVTGYHIKLGVLVVIVVEIWSVAMLIVTLVVIQFFFVCSKLIDSYYSSSRSSVVLEQTRQHVLQKF